MRNSKLRPKCLYLESNKFCTHRQNGFKTKFHRKVCGYKNHIDCEMFLEWVEELCELNKKISP